jgi:hypothetical protein
MGIPPELLHEEQRQVRQEQQRPYKWFDIPPRLAARTGVTRIGCVELTPEEEMMATRRGPNDAARTAFELAKEMLRVVWIEGERKLLSNGDGSADVFWARKTEGMAQLRSLILAAYAKIHNPDQGDVAGFLASQTDTLGCVPGSST